MQKIFLVLLLLSFPALATKKEPAPNLNAVAQYIIDGDTFSARVKLENEISISVRVRIMQIDAPEISGQCKEEVTLAQKSKERLAGLIPIGSVVKLEKIKDDRYLGRIDAVVKNETGLDVGEIMVAEKLARRYGGGKRLSWCE